MTLDITLDISEPKLEDLPAMAALCQALAPQHAGQALSPDALAHRCQGSRGIHLVARVQGQVVGLLLTHQAHAQRHDVEYLIVHPDHAGDSHVQQSLIDKLLVKLAARGVHAFQLSPKAVGGGADIAWQAVRWMGHGDMTGKPPVGRQTTCPLR